MNLVRQTMLQEAISKAQAAGTVTLDEICKLLPDDFGLTEPELVVALAGIPLTAPAAPESEPITEADVKDLRDFIRLATQERADVAAQMTGLSHIVRQRRAALAEALQTFVNGVGRVTPDQLKRDFLASEQQKRRDVAEGRVRARDDAPRDHLGRVAYYQKFGHGAAQGNFRRGPEGQRVFPSSMKGSRIVTDPVTGQKRIVGR